MRDRVCLDNLAVIPSIDAHQKSCSCLCCPSAKSGATAFISTLIASDASGYRSPHTGPQWEHPLHCHPPHSYLGTEPSWHTLTYLLNATSGHGSFFSLSVWGVHAIVHWGHFFWPPHADQLAPAWGDCATLATASYPLPQISAPFILCHRAFCHSLLSFLHTLPQQVTHLQTVPPLNSVGSHRCLLLFRCFLRTSRGSLIFLPYSSSNGENPVDYWANSL